jgi:lipoprotein-releasing system ATP-binding protein
MAEGVKQIDTDEASAPSGGNASMISLRGLCKRFEHNGVSIEILKNLNYDFDAGETVAIVGASGIGKSTLLHIIGTLDRPDQGQLRFKGRDLFKFNDAQLAHFRNVTVGFVFQFHHLLPEFSALENVMIPGLIQGLQSEDAGTAAKAILDRVGLSGRLNHRVGKLSGGEQQRVALARALVLKPAILLADEPTGNLDENNSRQIHDLLLELNQELGMTLIVVTHNPSLAALLTRKVTIVGGRLVALD